jgi:hypothetical protein
VVAAVEHDERVVGEALFLEHGEHRADGVVEPADVGVVAGEFAADFGQVFEEAGNFGDFLRFDPTARRLTFGEIVGAFHADERAVRVVTIDIVEERFALVRGPCAGTCGWPRRVSTGGG